MVKSIHLFWTTPCKIGIALILSVPFDTYLGARERIHLPSGEILVGDVISEDPEVIIFVSQGLGEIKIPVSPDLRRELIENSPVEPAPLPATEIATNEPSKPPSHWTRSVEGGLSFQQRGNADSNYAASLRANFTRVVGPNNLSLTLRYLVADQNNERSSDRFDSEAAFRHSLNNERFLLRSNLLYRFDRLREFSNYVESSFGFVYKFWDSEQAEFWIGPGATFNYTEPKFGEDGYRWLGDMRSGINIQFGPRISFEHQGVFLFRIDDFSNYRIRIDQALKAAITDQITVGLRYEYEYESILLFEDGRGEHRFFSTIELKY